MHQHLPDAQTPVDNSHKSVHERTGTEIATGQHDHGQAVREDERGNGANETRCVFEEPRRGVGTEERGASKGEEHAGHDG